MDRLTGFTPITPNYLKYLPAALQSIWQKLLPPSGTPWPFHLGLIDSQLLTTVCIVLWLWYKKWDYSYMCFLCAAFLEECTRNSYYLMLLEKRTVELRCKNRRETFSSTFFFVSLEFWALYHINNVTKAKDMLALYNPVIPLLGIDPREINKCMCPGKKTYIRIFIVAFLIVDKNWKQPKCPDKLIFSKRK